MLRRRIIKKIVTKFINSPSAGIYSSQTLYECLLCSCSMYLISKDERWKLAAAGLAERISRAQLNDGGFDIGYDFLFGKTRRKRHKVEATSPELVSIYALSLYANIFGDRAFDSSIEKGVRWALRYIRHVGDALAIPYAPLSYDDIHITNATSFAISACSEAAFCLNDDILACHCKDAVDGMSKFMNSQLTTVDGGGYWSYFYSSGEADSSEISGKVDNYHVAQQLWHHMMVRDELKSRDDRACIEKVSAYLKSKISEDGFIPYTENEGKVSGYVSVWGYASVLLPLSVLVKKGDLVALKKGRLIVDKLRMKAWNGKYFWPVLDSDWGVLDSNFYPRSDAWVLHSLSEWLRVDPDQSDLFEIIDIGFREIESAEFKGLENHAINFRKRVVGSVARMLKSIRG